MSKKNGLGDEFDNLGRVIEQEVNKTVGAITGNVQDVVRAVSETVRKSTASGAQRFGEEIRKTTAKGAQHLSDAMRNGQNPKGTKNAGPYIQPNEKTPFSQRDFQQQTQTGHIYRSNNYAAHKLTETPYNAGGWVKTMPGTALLVKRTLLAVLGGFLSLIGVCMAFGSTVVFLGLGTDLGGMAGLTVLLPMTVLALWGAYASFGLAGRLRRFQRYLPILDGKTNYEISELAGETNLRIGRVRGDLKKALKKGWFRAARLSPNGKVIFIDSAAYRACHSDTKPTPKAEMQNTPAQTAPAQGQEPLQSEGERFLQGLRGQKAMIDDPLVLEQVERIEQHSEHIFAWVEKHPSSASAVRRFTSYYLPTVLKLLKTYNEVDKQADGSAVASQIQSDIVGILYTVNTAFSSLQDGLLQDTALDISAEISALETVLAQEGLTDGAMRTGKNELQ